MKSKIPLVVDLDHTLINADLLQKSAIGVLKKRPWLIVLFPFWLARGKGYLKYQLVKRFDIDPSSLPYNQITINYIKEHKKRNVKIILATASHQDYASKIAQHLGLFDEVMASNKHFNLSSHNKANKLIARFSYKGFDYIGDHKRDLPVWNASNLAILVNVSNKVIKKTQHLSPLLLSKHL